MGSLHGRGHGRGHGGRHDRGLRHLGRRNHGRGHGRVGPGSCGWHGHRWCDPERALSCGNLHGNRSNTDLNRRARAGQASYRHAWTGGGHRRWPRGRWRRGHWGRRSARILPRAGSRTWRQDGCRHDGGPHARKGLGRRRYRCLRHVDGRRDRLWRWRRWIHVWGGHGLGRWRSTGLELGPAAQTELVEILVFLTATRTGDHERPSARIVGVVFVIGRFLPR